MYQLNYRNIKLIISIGSPSVILRQHWKKKQNTKHLKRILKSKKKTYIVIEIQIVAIARIGRAVIYVNLYYI